MGILTNRLTKILDTWKVAQLNLLLQESVKELKKSTASPTHPGTRQGDTDSTIDLALVSPKLVP